MVEHSKNLLEKVKFQKANEAIQEGSSGHSEKQIAWRIVISAVIVGVLGSIIHIILTKEAVASGKEIYISGSSKFILFTALGIVILLLFYLADYTKLGKYSKIIFVTVLVLYVLSTDGTLFVWVHEEIFASSLMLMMVPAYAGIIYKYREGSFGALIRSLLWILAPCGFVFVIYHDLVAVIMALSMLTQLTIAIGKGWFNVPKFQVIIAIWLFFVLVPISGLWTMYIFGFIPEHLIARVSFMLHLGFKEYYTGGPIGEIIDNSSIIGNSNADILGTLYNADNIYILTYIVAKWGVLAGLGVVSAVSIVILSGLFAFLKVKNQLGVVMGSGCMMVLAVNGLLSILTGFGVAPYFSSFLPFISAGGSNLLISYAFLGIILSIYKYKSVYPQHVDIGIRGSFKIGNIEIMKN